MRLIVTGAGGMLGQDVVRVLMGRGHEVVALGHADLDITSLEIVRDKVAGHGPDVVINCAAFIAVDAAESNRERALAVNGPRNRACRENFAALLQVSTDWVFSGEKDSPCGVFDPTTYGRPDPLLHC